jgi:hypothetical protein
MAQSSRALWAKRVERWKDSGLTAKEFAAEVGINAGTLSHWSWRLGRESRSTPRKRPAQAAKKKSARKPSPDPVQFIEVSPPQVTEGRFEIELRRGHRVFVPACFDAKALQQLVDVLEARG